MLTFNIVSDGALQRRHAKQLVNRVPNTQQCTHVGGGEEEEVKGGGVLECPTHSSVHMWWEEEKVKGGEC